MSEPIILGAKPSILTEILAELRDETLQADKQHFRQNMERAAEIIAYEVSKILHYTPREVITPLGSLDVPVLTSQPVIGVILRAALAMHPGFMRVFPQAESAFISAYRKHANNSDDFTIKVEYISTPDLEGKTLILLDPMIATGRTMVLCHNQFLNYGTPAQVILCGVIGSEEGIEYLTRHLPHAHIYVGAVDSELTARGYIVPGLGDAGDLAFGEKL